MFIVKIYSYNPVTANLKQIDSIELEKKMYHATFLLMFKDKIKSLTAEFGGILIDTSFKN
jgi:hypothetical protein